MRNQQWSKVKKKLESFICDSLKDRVDFTVTNYRKAHDQMGRAFITVDKKEVLNMCTITSDIALYRKERELIRNLNKKNEREEDTNYYDIGIQAHETIKEEGIYAQYDFLDAVEEYFTLPFEESLKSKDMVIKILSLIDRRVGKRTLQKLKEPIQFENDIVQYFYKLRCEAERLT